MHQCIVAATHAPHTQAAAREQRERLRHHFCADLRRQLYSDADDRAFYKEVQHSLKRLDELIEEGRVAVAQLEQHLLHVACDDPGAAVGMALILPRLQVRSDTFGA